MRKQRRHSAVYQSKWKNYEAQEQKSVPSVTDVKVSGPHGKTTCAGMFLARATGCLGSALQKAWRVGKTMCQVVHEQCHLMHLRSKNGTHKTQK